MMTSAWTWYCFERVTFPAADLDHQATPTETGLKMPMIPASPFRTATVPLARPLPFVLLFFNAGAHCVGPLPGATESLILTSARPNPNLPKSP
jgi:hypothetical protein